MGMIKHSCFSIQRHESDREAFFGDILILLLVFKDLFDPSEAFRLSEPADRVFVYAGSGAEPFKLGVLLELLYKAFKAAFFVEIVGNSFDASCEIGLKESRKRAVENARERHYLLVGRFGVGRELRE